MTVDCEIDCQNVIQATVEARVRIGAGSRPAVARLLAGLGLPKKAVGGELSEVVLRREISYVSGTASPPGWWPASKGVVTVKNSDK